MHALILTAITMWQEMSTGRIAETAVIYILGLIVVIANNFGAAVPGMYRRWPAIRALVYVVGDTSSMIWFFVNYYATQMPYRLPFCLWQGLACLYFLAEEVRALILVSHTS